MVNDIYKKLFSLLSPGQTFTPACALELARKLRMLADSLDGSNGATLAHKQPRDLDFAAFEQRFIALELLYLGHNYSGFARQDNNLLESIESHLFHALQKTRLIPPTASWQELKYTRGGRTDKGVSALSQVVTFTVRSSAKLGQVLPPPEEEIDYPLRINSALPKDIRIIGWTDVPTHFNARFSAKHRNYVYFFIDASTGSSKLNVDAMQRAASYLIGDHDFRNFCKMDVTNAKSWRRVILECDIAPVEDCTWYGQRLLALKVKGNAFLWHQIRCIAAILFMVGSGAEAPEIVIKLLDIETTANKPMYMIAPEEPLLLYSCVYDKDVTKWVRSAAAHTKVKHEMEAALRSHLVRASLIATVREKLEKDQVFGQYKNKAPPHISLMSRRTEPSLEERYESAKANANARKRERQKLEEEHDRIEQPSLLPS